MTTPVLELDDIVMHFPARAGAFGNRGDAVVHAVSVPVQAVGGLSIRQAIECPSRGAPLVVIGAPLVIDADGFKAASESTLHDVLSRICREIHGATA